MQEYAKGYQNKASTSGNGNLWSGPKPCYDVCLHRKLLADSEGHIS